MRTSRKILLLGWLILSSGCCPKPPPYVSVQGHPLVGSWRIDSEPYLLLVFSPLNRYMVLYKGKLLDEGIWDAVGNKGRHSVTGVEGGVSMTDFTMIPDPKDRSKMKVTGHFVWGDDPVITRIPPVDLEPLRRRNL